MQFERSREGQVTAAGEDLYCGHLYVFVSRRRDRAKILAFHVVADNSSIHTAPEIRRWLGRHPRFHMHFTPTYSSWLNLVEH